MIAILQKINDMSSGKNAQRVAMRAFFLIVIAFVAVGCHASESPELQDNEREVKVCLIRIDGWLCPFSFNIVVEEEDADLETVSDLETVPDLGKIQYHRVTP